MSSSCSCGTKITNVNSCSTCISFKTVWRDSKWNFIKRGKWYRKRKCYFFSLIWTSCLCLSTKSSPLLFTYCYIINRLCSIIWIKLNLFCVPITSTTGIPIFCTISISFSICNNLITCWRKSNRKTIPWRICSIISIATSPLFT